MESVWDYPRPPRLEPTGRRIVVRHRGRIVADTRRAVAVLGQPVKILRVEQQGTAAQLVLDKQHRLGFDLG